MSKIDRGEEAKHFMSEIDLQINFGQLHTNNVWNVEEFIEHLRMCCKAAIGAQQNGAGFASTNHFGFSLPKCTKKSSFLSRSIRHYPKCYWKYLSHGPMLQMVMLESSDLGTQRRMSWSNSHTFIHFSWSSPSVLWCINCSLRHLWPFTQSKKELENTSARLVNPLETWSIACCIQSLARLCLSRTSSQQFGHLTLEQRYHFWRFTVCHEESLFSLHEMKWWSAENEIDLASCLCMFEASWNFCMQKLMHSLKPTSWMLSADLDSVGHQSPNSDDQTPYTSYTWRQAKKQLLQWPFGILRAWQLRKFNKQTNKETKKQRIESCFYMILLSRNQKATFLSLKLKLYVWVGFFSNPVWNCMAL